MSLHPGGVSDSLHFVSLESFIQSRGIATQKFSAVRIALASSTSPLFCSSSNQQTNATRDSYIPSSKQSNMSASTSNSNHSNAVSASTLFSRLAAQSDISFAQFLKPLECMTLLYVSKAARKAGVRQLKIFQSVPMVQWKQQTFDAWLEHPTLGAGDDETNGTLRHMMEGEAVVSRLCGPVNLERIAENAEYIQSQIVVLEHKRTYNTEETMVAVFDGDGLLFQVYKLETRTDYGQPAPYVLREEENETRSPGALSEFSMSRTYYTNNLSYPHVLCYDSFNAHAASHYELVRFCFEDLDISPTEIVCAFWHALSANSGVIGNYLTLFFDSFDDEIEMIEEDTSEWIQYLIERFTVTEDDDDDSDAVGMDETADADGMDETA